MCGHARGAESALVLLTASLACTCAHPTPRSRPHHRDLGDQGESCRASHRAVLRGWAESSASGPQVPAAKRSARGSERTQPSSSSGSVSPEAKSGAGASQQCSSAPRREAPQTVRCGSRSCLCRVQHVEEMAHGRLHIGATAQAQGFRKDFKGGRENGQASRRRTNE